MSFIQRTNLLNKLIDYINYNYWDKEVIKCKYNMIQIPYGYENFFDVVLQEKMKHRYTKVTKFIRFSPDFFIMQENSNKDCFLEYKVTKTPRFSYKDNQWDYGQIEADALENYFQLISIDINVAVVIYCPYHSRPLLCGIPEDNWVVGSRQSTPLSNGSGTDFYNIDLSKIPSFSKFMETYFSILVQESKQLLDQNYFNILKNDNTLKIKHDARSYYNNKKYSTGFNWEINDQYYNS